MRSVKTIVFSAALLLLTTSIIYLIIMHTSTSETLLKNTQKLLEVENQQITNDLYKYLESEITGAEVIECIRTYGKKYSIDVNFPKDGGGYIARTITDVSDYLDPMNQVNSYGKFVVEIQNSSEAWIDSNVKYFASFKRTNDTIVGLTFTPLEGQASVYNYNGVFEFKYYQNLWELCQNYKALTELQEDLNYQLEHLTGTDEILDYSQPIFSSRIELLYDNYAKVYFYYGASIDDDWTGLNQSQKDELLQDLTKRQVFKFFRTDWNGEQISEIWDTKLPNLKALARPTKDFAGSFATSYAYEISNTTSNSVTMVIRGSIIGNYPLYSINNNNREWEATMYSANGATGILKLDNGETYKFLQYEEELKAIQEHFSDQYPKKIQTAIQNALLKLSSVDKNWNKWDAADKQKLEEARTYLVEARTLIRTYYNSYIICRQSCEGLRNKAELPTCVYELYEEATAAAEMNAGDLDDAITSIKQNSDDLCKMDSSLNEIVNNNDFNKSNFFSTNDKGYLNTAMVVMNKSVDISALRGTSSADNDYKDYIDNAILEIDKLLAREVD